MTHSTVTCSTSEKLANAAEAWIHNLIDTPLARVVPLHSQALRERAVEADPEFGVAAKALTDALKEAHVPSQAAVAVQDIFNTAIGIALSLRSDTHGPHSLHQHSGPGAPACPFHSAVAADAAACSNGKAAGACPVSHHAGAPAQQAPSVNAFELLGESAEHAASHAPAYPAAAATADTDDKTDDAMVDGEVKEATSNALFYSASTSMQLYDKLGGWEVLSAAVQEMYRRLYTDERTKAFFEGHSDRSKLMRHMTCFIGSALSGKMIYSPRAIWQMHKHHIQDMGLCCAHVDVMVDHLKDTLITLGVKDSVVEEAVNMLTQVRWVFAYSDEFHDPLDTQGRFRQNRSLRTSSDNHGSGSVTASATPATLSAAPSAADLRKHEHVEEEEEAAAKPAASRCPFTAK